MLRIPLSKSWWRSAALVGLPTLTFGSVITFGFTYDDHWTIVRNTALGRPIFELLAEIGRGVPADIPDASRPLMVLAMWLERSVFGEDPAGFHAVSLFVHIACTILIWRLARIITRRADVALAAAALFSVLPTNIEAVASINYGEDLFATLGILLTLVGVHAPAERAHGWRRATLVGGALAMALSSKESALVVVILVPLLARNTTAWWRRRERTVTVALAIFGSYVAWRMTLAIGDDGVARSGASLTEATALMPDYLLWCVTRPFWPLHSVPIYEAFAPPARTGVLVAAIWIVAFAWCIRAASPRTHPANATMESSQSSLSWKARLGPSTRAAVARGALLWLAAPMITCPWVGPINQRADRYLYLASFGAVLLAVLLFDHWLRVVRGRWPGPTSPAGDARGRWWRGGRILAAASLAVGLGLASYAGSRVWRSDLALFGEAVEQAPGSARAWTALGWAHRRAGQYDQSLEALQRAIAIDPQRTDTAVVLGGLLLVTGDDAGAQAIVAQLDGAGSGREPRGLRRLRECLRSATPGRCIGDEAR